MVGFVAVLVDISLTGACCSVVLCHMGRSF